MMLYTKKKCIDLVVVVQTMFEKCISETTFLSQWPFYATKQNRVNMFSDTSHLKQSCQLNTFRSYSSEIEAKKSFYRKIIFIFQIMTLFIFIPIYIILRNEVQGFKVLCTKYKTNALFCKSKKVLDNNCKNHSTTFSSPKNQ